MRLFVLAVYMGGDRNVSQFHRGTYTSHGSIKKGNRHSGILLRNTEVSNVLLETTINVYWLHQHVTTLASIYRNAKYVYPKEAIDECWEKVLLNQCMFNLQGYRSRSDVHFS